MKRQERTNKTGRILGGAVLLVALASCAKAPAELDPTGAAIRFGAATSYPNDERTRTEYSGFDENGNFLSSTSRFERIDWVSGHDRIRILCAQALGRDGAPNTQGDYVLGSPTANGKVSEAGADVAAGSSEFYWVNDVPYSFYALYPAPGTTSNYHTGTVTESQSVIELQNGGSTALVSGSIPGIQPLVAKAAGSQVFMPDMNYAYMYAQKRTARTDDNHVQLDFYPLVTALEFSLMAGDEAMELYDLVSVSLVSTSTDLWGDFTASLDAGVTAVPAVTKTGAYSEANKTLTVTLPSGTKLSRTTYTKVTFLALGVEQTDLTVKLTFSNGHSRKTVLKKKDDTMVSVGACKKVYIYLGIPSEPIYYEVQPMAEDPFTGSTPAYEALTRGLDPIDNSSDRGLRPQRFGVFALRNAEGVAFDAAGNPSDWYLENRDVYLEDTYADYSTRWSNGCRSGNAQVRDLAWWPQFDRLNFFAYAPYMNAVQPYTQGEETVTPPLVFPSPDYAGGLPRAEYTPDARVTNQVDLCLATPRFNRTKDTNPVTNPVPLTFRHTLTQVRLYVRLVGTRQPLHQYRVTDVSLSGLVGTNRLTYVDDESAPFRWDAIGADAPHGTGYDLTYRATQLDGAWVKFVGDPAGTGMTDSYTWVNAPVNGRLYLLPQEITSAAGLAVTVSLYKESDSSLISVLPPFRMSIPTGTAWEPDKTVSYLITLDVSKLVVLDIDAQVSDWADGGNTHPEQIIF